mgnify:FL=1
MTGELRVTALLTSVNVADDTWLVAIANNAYLIDISSYVGWIFAIKFLRATLSLGLKETRDEVISMRSDGKVP